MSISSTMKQAAADQREMEDRANDARIDRQLNRIADELPGLLKSIGKHAALAANPPKGLVRVLYDPKYNAKQAERLRKKLETWTEETKGSSSDRFLPEGLEKFSGYRRLREYCARPEVDIAIVFSSVCEGTRISIQPDENFANSTAAFYWPAPYGVIPAQKVCSIPAYLDSLAATAPQPAPVAQPPKAISVMAPLKLKP